jgi:PPM family protein phosphatase
VSYIAVSALSDVGLVRESNEDSLVVGPWTLCATVTDNPQTLLFPLGAPLVVAVADGLGGHPGGEVASALVVRQLAELGPSLDSEEAIRTALGACNRAVYAAAAGEPGLSGMGTTVAGVVVTPEVLFTFNVGDSRVYLVETGGIRQTTVDDRSSAGPFISILTQALGGEAEFESVEPHVTSAPLGTEACCLVCTDGLTDPVATDALARTLADHRDGRAAFELWKAAIEAGGPDNITLALVRVSTENGSGRQSSG